MFIISCFFILTDILHLSQVNQCQMQKTLPYHNSHVFFCERQTSSVVSHHLTPHQYRSAGMQLIGTDPEMSEHISKKDF